MIVSVNIPHHASLPGSRERLTADSPVFTKFFRLIGPLIMWVKGFLLRIVGMVGVVVVVI